MNTTGNYPVFRKPQGKFQPEHYVNLLRIFCTLVAIGMWVASCNFSVMGFNFKISNMVPVAFILAFAVLVVELVWNLDAARKSPTIFMIGVLAYIYGIYTNVLGIQAAQAHGGDLVFAIIVGIIMEVLPPSLFLFGLFGEGGHEIGDFISGVGKTLGFIQPNQQVTRQSQYHSTSNTHPAPKYVPSSSRIPVHQTPSTEEDSPF